ncbi:undecaprenyl-diphosphatase UppP [Candidatus Parcubacteria bacterium]|nr:MAG: undecaprenyl-diphosphatase UppP [Candidatus Parcubacteria bacterium]
MGNYILAVFAGIIQGITEFAPISSSGHLVLFHRYFNFTAVDEVFFDVALHLATFLALMLFFWPAVFTLIKSFVASLSDWDLKNQTSQRTAWYLLIATLPAALAGYFFENDIEIFLRNSTVVAFALIAVGVLLYLADKYSKQIKTLNTVNFSDSVIIGISQALALIPGVSRSGITIVAGLSCRLQRKVAARFSFLLSIPIVFGAGIKKVFDLNFQAINPEQWSLVFLAFAAATITGFLTIKYFLRFLENHSLKFFAFYRIILGIIILIILF